MDRYDFHDAYSRGRVERRMTVDGRRGHATNPYSNTDARRSEWARGWADEARTPNPQQEGR